MGGDTPMRPFPCHCTGKGDGVLDKEKKNKISRKSELPEAMEM